MSIEAGIYKGRAVAGSEQYGTTSKGNEQIVLELQLTDIGATLSTFLYFSEASAKYSIQRLRACGWTGDDLSKLDGIDANEIDVAVKYENYEGQEKMKVEIVTGGGGVKLDNQLDDKGKRAFGARFKALAAQSRGPTVARANGGASADGDAGFPFGKNASTGVKL